MVSARALSFVVIGARASDAGFSTASDGHHFDEEIHERPRYLSHVRHLRGAPCSIPRISGRHHSKAEIDGLTSAGHALVVTDVLDDLLIPDYIGTRWKVERLIREHGMEYQPTSNGRFGTGRIQRVQSLREYLTKNQSLFHIFAVNSPVYSAPEAPAGVAACEIEAELLSQPPLNRALLDMTLAALAPLFDDFTMRHIFSLGVEGSAVRKHSHDESWLALLQGRKAWWIAEGDADTTRFASWEEPCSRLRDVPPPGVQFCVQRPGEVLYLGHHADHATCNLDRLVLGVGAQGRTQHWNPVLRAAHAGRDADIKRFADANIVSNSAVAQDGESPLHRAAAYGHTAVLRLLLERGAHHSSTTRRGASPLHRAAQGGHVEALEILLGARARVDATDNGGLQAIHTAADAGHLAVAARLVCWRADPTAAGASGGRPLHAAAWGHLQLVHFLLDLRADPHDSDFEGVQAAHWAAAYGSREVLTSLANARADPRATDADGARPLHWAAANGRWHNMAQLLQLRARLRDVSGNGASALHWAAANGQLPVVTRLLRHMRLEDMRAITRRAHGVSPRHFATSAGHTTIGAHIAAWEARALANASNYKMHA